MVTGLSGSSPNAIAICSRRRSSPRRRTRATTTSISPPPRAGGWTANTISRRVALAIIDRAFVASQADSAVMLEDLLEPLVPAVVAVRRALLANAR
jgi:hypothetical protein